MVTHAPSPSSPTNRCRARCASYTPPQMLDRNVITKEQQFAEIGKLKAELEALLGGGKSTAVKKSKKGRTKRGFGGQQL